VVDVTHQRSAWPPCRVNPIWRMLYKYRTKN
jgi:hypothetical protein